MYFLVDFSDAEARLGACQPLPSLAAEQLTARQDKKIWFQKLLKRFDDEVRMGPLFVCAGALLDFSFRFYSCKILNGITQLS